MKPRLIIFFTILLINLTLSANTLVTIDDKSTALTNFKTSYFVDHSGEMSIQEVIDAPFTPSANKFTLGMNKNSTWVKIDLHNQTSTTKQLHLHNLQGFYLKKIGFYEVSNRQITHSLYHDLSQTIDYKLFKGASAIYSFTLQPNEHKSLYMLSYTQGYQIVTLELFDSEYSLEALMSKNNLIFILQGGMLAFALYSLFMFFSIWKREFLYYTLILSSIAIWQLYLQGVIVDLFDVNIVMARHINLFVTIMPIFTALFVKTVFQTVQKYQRENLFLNSLIMIFSLNTLYGFFDLSVAIRLTSFLYIYLIIGMSIVAISFYRKRDPLAPLFILGHVGFYLTSNLIALLFYNGLVPYNSFTSNAVAVGSILEAIVFSLILAKRIQYLERDNQLKQAEIIEKSKKAQLGEMLSIIAHQWKQPLSVITTTTAQYTLKKLTNKPLSEDELSTMFKTIESQIEYASQSVDEFRHFFNPNQKPQQNNLVQTIESAISLLETTIQENHITLHKDLHLTLPITTYHNDLIQVLINLIKNAIEQFDTQQRDKWIAIRAYEVKSMSLIEIEDSAGGIQAEVIDKIFDQYFSTKDSADGTGLGLDLSKTIIEQKCQGKIEVKNGELGALFTLTVPDLKHRGD